MGDPNEELRRVLFKNARAEVEALRGLAKKLPEPDQRAEADALALRLELMLRLLENSEAPRNS